MKKDVVLKILGEAIVNKSPVMVHFGYELDNFVAIAGPKEPIVKVEMYARNLVVTVTESNMRFFMNPKDIVMIQIADLNDPRFQKKTSEHQAPGMYN